MVQEIDVADYYARSTQDDEYVRSVLDRFLSIPNSVPQLDNVRINRIHDLENGVYDDLIAIMSCAHSMREGEVLSPAAFTLSDRHNEKGAFLPFTILLNSVVDVQDTAVSDLQKLMKQTNKVIDESRQHLKESEDLTSAQ